MHPKDVVRVRVVRVVHAAPDCDGLWFSHQCSKNGHYELPNWGTEAEILLSDITIGDSNLLTVVAW